MTSQRSPLILRAWLLVTWCLAGPITLLARHLHRKMGADPARFPERLGQHGEQSSEEVIWFHAASLGEVMQIGPLARSLMDTQGARVLVTTTTAAGADWVARELPFVTHRFAPIDTPRAVRAFLATWSISAAIFIEGDLWPRLVQEAQGRGIPHILLNARHSRTRQRLKTVYATLLASFCLVTCRSQAIAKEMLELCLSKDLVHTLPDLRLTLPRLKADQGLTDALAGIIGQRPIWLAASTHPDDEEAVLKAQDTVLNTFPNALLIVAPRHPRRGASLRKQASEMAFNAVQRSLNEETTAQTKVYIADTLGELASFYSVAPVAFLGGSFGKEGGHNPYEPASFATAVLHGPHVSNFRDAYAALAEVGAAEQVETPEQLGSALLRLMDTQRQSDMSRAGQAFMDTTKDSLGAYADLVIRAMDQGTCSMPPKT